MWKGEVVYTTDSARGCGRKTTEWNKVVRGRQRVLTCVSQGNQGSDTKKNGRKEKMGPDVKNEAAGKMRWEGKPKMVRGGKGARIRGGGGGGGGEMGGGGGDVER